MQRFMCNKSFRDVMLGFYIVFFMSSLFAVGESSTRFNLFVPALNSANYRYSSLIITASGDGVGGVTTVNVWDMPSDSCPYSQCDPYGVMGSGADATVDGDQFSTSLYTFTADDVGRFVVITDSAFEENKGTYEITAVSSGTDITINGTLLVDAGVSFVIAQPGDIDDSFKNIRLQRGESFVVFFRDANQCLTGGICSDFNSMNTRSSWSKSDVVTFYDMLSPTDDQKAALSASLVTYPVTAINDDGGPARPYPGGTDGDYFIIKADAPVTVQNAVKSEWEHDFAVSDTKNAMGQSFYIFSAPRESVNGARDIEVFSYYDNTYVKIYRISKEDESVDDSSCTTCVCTSYIDCRSNIAEADWDNKVVLKTHTGADHMILDAGESLNLWNRSIEAYEEENPGSVDMRDWGIDLLEEGHSYYIETTNPVTVMYGVLQYRAKSGSRSAKDGGSMIPSANGSTSGDLFLFTIPSDKGKEFERELRITSFNNDNEICLGGLNYETGNFEPIPFDGQTMDYPCIFAQKGESIDLVGGGQSGFDALLNYDLFGVFSNPGRKINIAEANWMETGSPGTSDMASFISPQYIINDTSEETNYLIYMPPPGNETYIRNVEGTYSHIFVFAEHDNTQITISPADISGAVPAGCEDEFPHDGNTVRRVTIAKDGYYDFRLDNECYSALNNPPVSRPYLQLDGNNNISVMVSNYNDNWLNYVSSLLPATPNMSMEVTPSLLSIATDETDAPVRLGSAEIVIRSQHVFPVKRQDSLTDVVFTILIPDGLALDGDLSYSGMTGSPSLNSAVRSDGVTEIIISNISHDAFAFINITIPVVVVDTYYDDSKVSGNADDMLSIRVKEEGTLFGQQLSGYTSGAVRIIRCVKGDSDKDVDNDGHCNALDVCHTINNTLLCSGADICPNKYDSGTCPSGYTCENWGVCSPDESENPCAADNLEGSCAVGIEYVDKGLACDDGVCVEITEVLACENGGTLCPERKACINNQCVKISEPCSDVVDDYGKCPSSYSCIAGTCTSIEDVDLCENGGIWCPHDMSCVDGICEKIAVDDRCEDGGSSCPHHFVCYEGACIEEAELPDVTDEDVFDEDTVDIPIDIDDEINDADGLIIVDDDQDAELTDTDNSEIMDEIDAEVPDQDMDTVATDNELSDDVVPVDDGVIDQDSGMQTDDDVAILQDGSPLSDSDILVDAEINDEVTDSFIDISVVDADSGFIPDIEQVDDEQTDSALVDNEIDDELGDTAVSDHDHIEVEDNLVTMDEDTVTKPDTTANVGTEQSDSYIYEQSATKSDDGCGCSIVF